MASKSAAYKSTASAKPLLAKVLIFGFLAVIAVILWVSLFSKAPSNSEKNNTTQEGSKKPSTTTSVLNSDSSENWQLYNNEKYSYQIKYPKDWYVKTYPEIPNRTLFNDSSLPESQTSDSEPVFSEIEIFVTEEKNIKEEIDKLKSTNQFENYNESQIEVDGNSATRVGGVATGESYIKGKFLDRVYVNHEGWTYSLTFISIDKKNLEIFNQMLSAFRFD